MWFETMDAVLVNNRFPPLSNMFVYLFFGYLGDWASKFTRSIFTTTITNGVLPAGYRYISPNEMRVVMIGHHRALLRHIDEHPAQHAAYSAYQLSERQNVSIREMATSGKATHLKNYLTLLSPEHGGVLTPYMMSPYTDMTLKKEILLFCVEV